MAERRVATKGRRLGSSRRKQLREGSSEPPATSQEPPWASEAVQKVQDLLREQAKERAGFVTHSEMQKLQEEALPCSREELELVFDGLDAAGSGQMSTQEFTAGLRQCLGSQKAAREHRRRKTASRRGHLELPSPALEGMDSEDRRHFTAFMDQLGMDISEGQEIWQLWENLQKDEPQLLGNLEDFLAKLKHHIQEARSKKEALEVTLSKYKAEHEQEVQQLSEPQEQQIQQDQQQLEQELETQCHSLHSMNQATSPEKQQLEESSQVLEKDLQHLQTHRHLQIRRDRVVAELPSKTPVSPQTSLEKSKKNLSKMQLRLGSQGDEPKAKSTHQVVWEVLPAELSLLGLPPRASPTGEDPFPELLKQEHFSDQSSLLREMNDAIAALSKQLKPQALATPPDSVHHPWEAAEPQTGPEQATAHSTTPMGLQETVPGHMDHKLLEGDLREEGAATTEHPAPDGTQAGGSVGAGHCRAQELGTEQGESPEEAQRMLFLQGESLEEAQRMLFPQGKGTGVRKLMVKVAEHLQGALGERMEAGEPAQVEVEGEGWMQEKTGWEKAEPPGEAKEETLSQGETVEAGLGPAKAGKAGLAAGWQLAMEELQLAAAPGEHSQPLAMGLGEEAEMPSGISKKLEMKLGEHLEPEPSSQSEAQMEAAQEDSVLPKVTVAPGPGMLEEEHVGVEVHPQGDTLDADVPGAQHGGSSRARAEEEEREVMQPREAEPQLQDESGRGDAAVGAGSLGTEVSLPAALPPASGQEGGVGTDVQPLEAQSRAAKVQLLAKVEAALQPPAEASYPETEQAGSVAPGVQPLQEEPELELGEEMGAAAVCGEGPSPAETPVRSPGLDGLLLVQAQEVALVEAEDAQAETQLGGDLSPETPRGEEGGSSTQLMDEAEDGRQGQFEHELPQEPVLDLQGVTLRQGEGAGAGVQPLEETLILGTLEEQSTGAKVQLTAEIKELKETPEESTEAELQPLSVPMGTEQGWSMASGVQGLAQAAKAELVGMREAEDGQAELQLGEGLRPETPWGEEGGSTIQLKEEAEDGALGQGEHGLLQEPVLDVCAAGVGQGEGKGVILSTLGEQSTDANVQLTAVTDQLKVTPGGSMEAGLQLSREASSLGTEQGWSMAPDVQGLAQAAKAELVEREAEDAQAELQLGEGLRPETLWGEEGGSTIQLEEEEAEEQRQDECELLQEPVLDVCAAGVGQGEGAGAGVQPLEQTLILGTLEEQSTGAKVQLIAEPEELKSTSGGSMEADLTPLGTAGLWQGKLRHSPGSEAALCALPTTEVWAEAAGAHVSLLAETTSQPEHAAASEAPGLETTLRSFPDPAGQILEDTQALGIPQGERSATGEKPLDGAEGLEVVQVERLEAGERSLVATQSLELNQGHDDEVSVVASLLSEVASELSTPELGTLMQEDVLIPNVWCLGASGEAAPSELQEQGSAQAVEVRPQSASQQLEEKPPRVMEREQVSARPAEHPEEEMPPASTLQTRVQQKEDTGNDQPGMVLGDAAKSSLQLERQLLGEQSNDLRDGQWKGKQEAGQKMSQEGKPSPGTSGAVSADEAGAAPRSSPEASLGPDHLYNVLFVGDSHVGKTSFLHRLHADTFSPHLTATVGLDYQVKNLLVDNKSFALRLWDSAGQERYRSVTKQFFRRADGVVLMYDLTSQQSFSDVTYWLSCIQEGAGDGVTILLLGNKSDCAAERQVPTKEGELLAKEHQLLFYECSAASGHNVADSMVSLARLLKVREDELKKKEEEVSQAPQKKKSCCW